MAAVAKSNMPNISDPSLASNSKKDASHSLSGVDSKDHTPAHTAHSGSNSRRGSVSDSVDHKSVIDPELDPNGTGNHQMEPNPFDAQFGTNSTDGPPSKNPLPGFPTLTSPAPGGSSTPTWRQAGPLSPAILSGTSGSGDYFSDHHFRGGIPTPKESSLRSGLTPASSAAGAAFEFPPSGSNGGAGAGSASSKGVTSNPSGPSSQLSGQSDYDQQTAGSASRHNKSYSSHDAKQAANGLFMLAQSTRSGGLPSTRPQVSSPLVSAISSYDDRNGLDDQGSGYPDDGRTYTPSNHSPSYPDSHLTDPQLEALSKTPASAGRGKKMTPATNGGRMDGGGPDSASSARRRNTDESPSSVARRQKRQKTADQQVPESPSVGDNSFDNSLDDFSGTDSKSKPGNGSGAGAGTGNNGNGSGNSQSKMTDEEKRRNFLERNRVAALKCRQRKKQWLGELQSQCSKLSTENDALIQQFNVAKAEIAFLKNILFVHRDVLSAQWSESGVGGTASLSQILESGLVAISSLTGQPKPMPEAEQQPAGAVGAYPYVATMSAPPHPHGHAGVHAAHAAHVIGPEGLAVAQMTAPAAAALQPQPQVAHPGPYANAYSYHHPTTLAPTHTHPAPPLQQTTHAQPIGLAAGPGQAQMSPIQGPSSLLGQDHHRGAGGAGAGAGAAATANMQFTPLQQVARSAAKHASAAPASVGSIPAIASTLPPSTIAGLPASSVSINSVTVSTAPGLAVAGVTSPLQSHSTLPPPMTTHQTLAGLSAAIGAGSGSEMPRVGSGSGARLSESGPSGGDGVGVGAGGAGAVTTTAGAAGSVPATTSAPLTG